MDDLFPPEREAPTFVFNLPNFPTALSTESGAWDPERSICYRRGAIPSDSHWKAVCLLLDACNAAARGCFQKLHVAFRFAGQMP